MKLVKPSNIKGKIDAPSSKSVAQRAILCALFSEKTKIIINSPSDDVKSALLCFEALGGTIDGETFTSPNGKKDYVELNVGESGFLARALPYIAPFFTKEFKIIGHGSLQNRNVAPPFLYKGSGAYEIENLSSSQYISGLLIALSQSGGDSIVKLKNIPSFPYLELTRGVVNSFGGKIEQLPGGFLVKGKRGFNNIEYVVEGDWSGASNFLVLAALAGEVSIRGLKINSMQGDKEILNVLRDFGADLSLDEDLVTVRKNLNRSFVYDSIDTPDLVPALLVLAAKADGTSEIRGIHRLAGKESDRDKVLLDAFKSLGVLIERERDSFFVQGGRIRGGKSDSSGDHRIAMALSCLGVVSEEGVAVVDPSCVSKSYPDFFCSMTSVGATILEE